MNLKKNIPFFISLAFFLFSLTQVAYKTDYSDQSANEASSLLIFLIGWLGIVFIPYGIPWLANPLLIIAWILFLRRKIGGPVILSLLASLFSASFLLLDKMPANEAPTYANITAIGLGYWLWLLSCITFFIGTTAIYFNKKGSNIG
jgi:hypothetical protein